WSAPLRLPTLCPYTTLFRSEPFLQRALDQRLLTVSLAVALLMVSLAWAMSGRMGFSLMPRAESDQVQATVTLPVGSPIAEDRRRSEEHTSELQSRFELVCHL